MTPPDATVPAFVAALLAASALVVPAAAQGDTPAPQPSPVLTLDEHAVFALPGGTGPGVGKHVVLVAGDEEYRSEEALPQLAKILASQHGFRCTVLFSIDPP